MCGNLIKVDGDVFEKYQGYKWRIDKRGLVVTSRIGNVREVPLRRLVLYGSEEASTNRRVYYKDGDNLNLLKENLSTTNVIVEYSQEFATCTMPNGSSFTVDISDIPLIKTRSWSITKAGYITCVGSRGKREYLHRLLTSPPKGHVVDHINRNPSDNQKSNLRVCSHRENMMNRGADNFKGVTSLYKGLSKNVGGSFLVRVNRSRFGSYSCEIAAANVYNHHAKDIFKDFAKLNDVPFIPIDECETYRVFSNKERGSIEWAD